MHSRLCEQCVKSLRLTTSDWTSCLHTCSRIVTTNPFLEWTIWTEKYSAHNFCFLGLNFYNEYLKRVFWIICIICLFLLNNMVHWLLMLFLIAAKLNNDFRKRGLGKNFGLWTFNHEMKLPLVVKCTLWTDGHTSVGGWVGEIAVFHMKL